MIERRASVVLTQNSFVRFLCVGAANTLGTLIIYVVLVAWIPAWLAWAIAFGCGIIFVNIVYPRFVFRVRGTALGFAGNSVYYLISFFVSEALLSGAIEWFELNPRVAGVIVAAIMVPVNFLAARFFFSGRNRGEGSTTRNSAHS